jgi:hypothetical protein
MLAQLTLAMGPRTVVAVLGADFEWRCDDLLTQTYLNSCHGPLKEDSPAAGPVGYEQAQRATAAVQAAGWDVSLYMPALNQNAA